MHHSEQLVDKSGGLIPKMDKNYMCLLHWRKVGCLSEADIGIFATMVKVEMCRGWSLFIDIGR